MGLLFVGAVQAGAGFAFGHWVLSLPFTLENGEDSVIVPEAVTAARGVDSQCC
jgi:hypothetical protein